MNIYYFHKIKQYGLISLLCFVSATLIACGSNPHQETYSGTPASVSSEISQPSASQLEQQAALALEPEASSLWLQAADMRAEATEWEYAERNLRNVHTQFLAQAHKHTLWRVLSAEIAIAQNVFSPDRPDSETIQRGLNSALPADLRARQHAVIAATFDYWDVYTQASNQFFACKELAQDPALVTRCTEAYWHSLLRLSQHLTDAPGNFSHEQVAWFELAQLCGQPTGTLHAQQSALELWMHQHPNHEAALNPPTAVLDILGANSAPKRVLVLLPMTGPLASAAESILEGFQAAMYDAAGEHASIRTELSVIDTHALPIDLIAEIIRDAPPDAIVGPLDRQLVSQLAQLELPNIPILALNNFGDQINTPQSALGFSLAIESEASQIARTLRIQGKNRHIAIVPNSEWGERAIQALTNEMSSDQTHAAILRFDSGQTVAPALESDLLIDQSTNRMRTIQRLLGKVIEFTPRRRQDVDAIFLASNTGDAQQIVPVFAFLFASDIPIYATSTIYPGQSGRLDDLDDAAFLAAEYVLNPNNEHWTPLRQHAPRPQSLQTLQAMGMDAYHLIQRIALLRSHPELSFSGQTGILSTNGSHDLARQLNWAHIERGQVTFFSP